VEVNAYFTALVAERRGNRQDGLISELLAARGFGDRISDAELVTNLVR
jgi:cytochrome P450